MNREERNEWQIEYRKNNGNIHTKQYEKTINGFTMRMYRNMQSRINGVQKKKAHLYMGKCLLPREDFYNWIRNNDVFLEMFISYKESGYNQKICPTVDRIDPSKGYYLDNMRIVTHSFNSANTSRRTNG